MQPPASLAMPNRLLQIAVAALIAVLSTAPLESRAVVLDAATIDRGADLAYRRALEPLVASRRLNSDSAVVVRVRRAANRIVPGAAALDPAVRTYHWSVNVVAEPAADVVAYPGGRLLVNEGLVSKTGFADEEIAAVIAFALVPTMLGEDQARLAEALRNEGSAADPNQLVLAVSDALKSPRSGRYSPAQVKAADRAAVEILARSAYDPRAAASAWRRLATIRGGIADFAPVSDARLADLDAAIKTVLPLYEEARKQAAATPPAPPPRGSQRPGPVIR